MQVSKKLTFSQKEMDMITHRADQYLYDLQEGVKFVHRVSVTSQSYYTREFIDVIQKQLYQMTNSITEWGISMMTAGASYEDILTFVKTIGIPTGVNEVLTRFYTYESGDHEAVDDAYAMAQSLRYWGNEYSLGLAYMYSLYTGIFYKVHLDMVLNSLKSESPYSRDAMFTDWDTTTLNDVMLIGIKRLKNGKIQKGYPINIYSDSVFLKMIISHPDIIDTVCCLIDAGVFTDNLDPSTDGYFNQDQFSKLVLVGDPHFASEEDSHVAVRFKSMHLVYAFLKRRFNTLYSILAAEIKEYGCECENTGEVNDLNLHINGMCRINIKDYTLQVRITREGLARLRHGSGDSEISKLLDAFLLSKCSHYKSEYLHAVQRFIDYGYEEMLIILLEIFNADNRVKGFDLNDNSTPVPVDAEQNALALLRLNTNSEKKETATVQQPICEMNACNQNNQSYNTSEDDSVGTLINISDLGLVTETDTDDSEDDNIEEETCCKHALVSNPNEELRDKIQPPEPVNDHLHLYYNDVTWNAVYCGTSFTTTNWILFRDMFTFRRVGTSIDHANKRLMPGACIRKFPAWILFTDFIFHSQSMMDWIMMRATHSVVAPNEFDAESDLRKAIVADMVDNMILYIARYCGIIIPNYLIEADSIEIRNIIIAYICMRCGVVHADMRSSDTENPLTAIITYLDELSLYKCDFWYDVLNYGREYLVLDKPHMYPDASRYASSFKVVDRVCNIWSIEDALTEMMRHPAGEPIYGPNQMNEEIDWIYREFVNILSNTFTNYFGVKCEDDLTVMNVGPMKYYVEACLDVSLWRDTDLIDGGHTPMYVLFPYSVMDIN